MDRNKDKRKERLYTFHGVKKAQGIPSVINGQRALAAFDGDEIVGYTTLDELTKEFYTRELPKYDLNF